MAPITSSTRIYFAYLDIEPFIILNLCSPFKHILGLGFRPMPPESNVESTLIWYKANNEDNYQYWTDELDKFLNGKQYYLNCRVNFIVCTRTKVD
jgi:hypothetical protein